MPQCPYCDSGKNFTSIGGHWTKSGCPGPELSDRQRQIMHGIVLSGRGTFVTSSAGNVSVQVVDGDKELINWIDREFGILTAGTTHFTNEGERDSWQFRTRTSPIFKEFDLEYNPPVTEMSLKTVLGLAGGVETGESGQIRLRLSIPAELDADMYIGKLNEFFPADWHLTVETRQLPDEWSGDEYTMKRACLYGGPAVALLERLVPLPPNLQPIPEPRREAEECPYCGKMGGANHIPNCDEVALTRKQESILTGLLVSGCSLSDHMAVRVTNRPFLEWVDGEMGALSNGVSSTSNSADPHPSQYAPRKEQVWSWRSRAVEAIRDFSPSSLDKLSIKIWFGRKGTRREHDVFISTGRGKIDDTETVIRWLNDAYPADWKVDERTEEFGDGVYEIKQVRLNKRDGAWEFMDWLGDPLPGCDDRWAANEGGMTP